MGGRGRGNGLGSNEVKNVADETHDASKSVSRYFFPGMDPKIRKHPLYTTRSVTEVVTNSDL